jgi:hypothetical protein
MLYYIKNQLRDTPMYTTDKETQAVARHHSDGSELIPAEVQAHTPSDDGQLLNKPLAAGYTVDDEGMFNNYAIEPAMSLAEYPTPERQRRYILQGAAAILLVALTVLIAFAIR